MAKSHRHITVKKCGLMLHRRNCADKGAEKDTVPPTSNLTHDAPFSLARGRDPAVPLSHSWSQPAKKRGSGSSQVLLGVVVPAFAQQNDTHARLRANPRSS